MSAEQASQIEPCEHHWISSHQPDFPSAIYWVRQCSQCQQFDGADLSEQVRIATDFQTERADRNAMRAHAAEGELRAIRESR